MNQTAFAAVGIYAALNCFVLFWLVNATGQLRRRHKILIGDGGNAHLIRVMRGHANAAENMPIMLILLLVAAAMGAPVAAHSGRSARADAAAIGTPVSAIHALGIAFTIGRVLHAQHFTLERAPQWQRSVGFMLGALSTLVAALGVLAYALVLVF